MKRALSSIVILLFSLLVLNISAQTYDWKRMSYSICDSSYQNMAQVANIVNQNSNYYFAFHLDPLEIDNYPNPSYWSPGFLHPVILSDNNQLIMADSISIDSVKLSPNFYRGCIQNDTFRVLVNYPFLDSTYFADHSLMHKGLPIPKYNGFLMINYDINGTFLGYDSLPLPHELQQYSNINSAQSVKAIHLRRVMVNSQNEIFLFLGIWSRSGATHSGLSDSTAFIVKYNANTKQPIKMIAIRDDYGSCTPYENMDVKMYNNNLYLLGQISDSVFVDNILFISDTSIGYNTYTVKFNSNLNILQSGKFPGTFYDFAVGNDKIYYSAYYDYPLIINSDSIFPSVYIDPYDTVVMSDAFIGKISTNNYLSNYILVLDGCSPPTIVSSTNRVFAVNMGSCGDFQLANGDTVHNPISSSSHGDIFLVNENSLLPLWYFSADNLGLLDLNVFNDKFLLTYESLYYLTFFPGDNDSIFFTNYAYYTPIALAQIDITGLGFEEMNSLQTGELTLFPNPTNNILNIAFEQENEYQIQVYDISGKLVLQKELSRGETQLKVTELKSGLYILRAQSNESVFVGRFLKE